MYKSSESWFNEYCGMPVESWDLNMQSLPENVQYDAGNFQTYTIAKLKDMAKIKTQNKNTSQIKESKLNQHDYNVKPLVFRFRSSTISNEHEFDISAIQIMEYKKNDKIMTQVASNFNCLELPSEHISPFSPDFIEGIMTDTTQGPAAASGCIAGTLQRISIHKLNPINLLQNTNLDVKNGKLYASQKNLEIKFDEDNIMIGLQKNVRANFIRYSTIEYIENGPIIDQVYTSTCICDKMNKNELSKKLLKCAYDGTYLSAIECDTTKLFLTLIGGCSFSNNINYILDAIYDAHIMYSPMMPDNSVVIVPIYDVNKNLFKDITGKFTEDFVDFIVKK
jgi:hypothetical protein